MRKLEEFYRLKADPEAPDHLVKKAVTVVSLQNISEVRKVWVFNGKVHIGDDGQLLMLGAELLALHYEAIYSQGGKVPAAIARGNVSLGKSMSTEAALSLLGVQGKNKVKSITDTQAMKSVSKTTLGFIIDDPSKPSEIAEKLLYHFERGVRDTHASKDTPRTTFLTSVNMTCLESLSEMDAR